MSDATAMQRAERAGPMVARLALHERLDMGAAAPLKAALVAQTGQDIEVDGADVTQLGTLCLQVLMAAARDWRAAGKRFDLADPSAALTQQLSLFGLTPETLAGGDQ